MKAALQYGLNVTPEKVRAIHAFYVGHTRRERALDARVEAGWIELLSAHTMEDCQIVIRYLHKRITNPQWRGPRHPGSLKLNAENFFNADKFVEDLAEAKSILGAHRAKQQGATRQIVQSVGEMQRTVEVPREQAEPVSIDEGTRQFMRELEDRKRRTA